MQEEVLNTYSRQVEASRLAYQARQQQAAWLQNLIDSGQLTIGDGDDADSDADLLRELARAAEEAEADDSDDDGLTVSSESVPQSLNPQSGWCLLCLT